MWVATDRPRAARVQRLADAGPVKGNTVGIDATSARSRREHHQDEGWAHALGPQSGAFAVL